MTLAAIALGPIGTAHAQGGAGLVVEVSGTTSPPLRAFREIPGGTTVRLTQGSKLTFVHYQSCRAVTVVGGSVTITPASYVVSGGTKSEEGAPCPRVATLRRGGETAGLVLRGVPRFALAPRPTFLLVGDKSDAVTSVRFVRPGTDRAETVLEAPVVGSRFVWPEGAAPLAPDTEYDLVFRFREAAAEWTLPGVLISVPPPGGVPAPLTLIRID